jgi:hypothetical protein
MKLALCQRRSGLAWLVGLMLPMLLLTTTDTAVAGTGAPSSSGALHVIGSGSCGARPTLVRKTFPAIPNLDNTFLPLVPGMQFILDGLVIGPDGLRHPHRTETTVTNLTKVIDGVRTIVVFDLDIQDGVIAESEIFFQAQDMHGTVWLLGEYPEEWDNGRLTGAPSAWLSGVLGGHAGITMLANPQVGAPTYIQGLARRVGFFDCATVFRVDEQTCVPVSCYGNVLVTDEFSPLDPAGGHQRKFYAPGVGNVRVGAAGGVDPETLKLTRASVLCGDAFARVRWAAQRQDRRAYRIAPDVYGSTLPAEATLSAADC